MTRFASAVLACLALVLVTAPAASAGTGNIEIVAGAVNQNVDLNLVSGVQTYTASGATPHQIGADNINAFLAAGTDVEVDTSQDNDGDGLILVNGAINSANANGDLTLDAAESTQPTSPPDVFEPAISQTASITLTGKLTLVANNNMDVNLLNAANDFNEVTIPISGGIEINDADNLVMGAFDSNGTIEIKAGGNITQTGPLDSVGVTIFEVGANDVALTNAGNSPNALRFRTARHVNVVENEAVILSASNLTGGSVISGNLTVTAGGSITDSSSVGFAPLAVTGSTTLSAPVGSDITLDDALNNFSSVGVTAANHVTLRDANALQLNASTISGNLNVTTSGIITQSAAISVTGISTLAAGATNNILLTEASNAFATVSITSAFTVQLRDVNAVVLGTSTVSGNFTLTTGGAVTQSGALTVDLGALFIAGATNDVTLTDPSNDFASIRFETARNVSVTDLDALQFSLSTISGTLTANSAGAITQTNSLAVTGTATFAAGAGNNISLNHASNDFGIVVITSGNNVLVTDTNALTLGTSTVSGSLTIDAGGVITQSGGSTILVTGSTSLDATTGSNITLTNAGNNFSTLEVTSSDNVSVTDANALVLDASTISGGLNVTTSGTITDSGALAVTGTGTFAAGPGNNITLDNANNFAAVMVTSGNNVVLNDVNALALGTSTVSGDLTVTGGGAVTQTGAATVSGTTTATGSPVTLDQAGNNFGSAVGITSSGGGAAAVEDTNDLTLSSSTSGGSLTVTADDDLDIPGAATVAATGALRVVADDGNPASPAIGTGGISVGPGAALTGGGAIRLYGSQRVANSITGTATFNGSTFTPGTIFNNSAREQWGVYSPAGTATAPFTFFYKNTDATSPDATVTAPADGATFERNQVVNADYACTDGGGGAGVTSCTGPVVDGSPIDTATLGQKTFKVDAVSGSGGTGSKTVTYTVVDTTKPTVTLTAPADGANFNVGQAVAADYSCADETGLASCTGTVANGAAINTATKGVKTFIVQATDGSGNTTSKTATYTVVDPNKPTITLTSPANGANFNVGQVVTADYACADDTGLASCAGTVADGAAVDTSSEGVKTFTVEAIDESGNTASSLVSYTVGYELGACRRPQNGSAGADVLTGTANGDLLNGLAGDDTLSGGLEVDCLFGADGNDRLDGNEEGDWLWGGTGDDRLRGRDGDDKLRGESDEDSLFGSDGNDGMKGGPGDDRLNGDAGDDYLSGGEGNDRLNGGAGSNTYFGREGNDTIRARNGIAEDVNCGKGNDTAYLDENDRTRGCNTRHRG